MRTDYWTQKELDILRREFPTRTTKEVAAMLGRSYQGTAVKASLLGLKKKRYGTVWTKEMLMLLRNFFPIMFNRPLAKWIGVSTRTLIRKARELGLEKEPGFLEKRRQDISELAAEGLRRSPRRSSNFKKGVRNNPAGEFKPGYVESPETKAKRIESLKRSWVRRKRRQELKYYGIGINR